MATHSSILTWRIPWTKGARPGIQSIGSQRDATEANLAPHSTEWIYKVVLVPGVQQSDSVIHISIVFQIIFPFRLLWNTE